MLQRRVEGGCEGMSLKPMVDDSDDDVVFVGTGVGAGGDDVGLKGEAVMKKKARQEADTQRMSKRKKTSRIVNVGGHAILRENNYVLKGLSYSYDTYEEEVENTKTVQQVVTSKKRIRAAKPRIISREEIKRMKHVKKCKQLYELNAKKRAVYMSDNLSKLSSFLEPKVYGRLENLRNSGSIDEYRKLIQPHKDLYYQPELIVGGDLRDYQLVGLNWMAKMHKMSCPMILGDEMGLGKTLQTISLLCHLKENDELQGPSIIVCPLSVLNSWMNEFKKWAPSLKVVRFHSSDMASREEIRMDLMKNSLEYDAIVTTYEMTKVNRIASLWSKIHFKYLVLDEGHIIKCSTTQVAQALRGFHFESTLLLTGTPLQNNLGELWSLLNFMFPEYFTASKAFDNAFDLTKNEVDSEVLRKAHQVLHMFMLRRLKTEVEKLLPKKIETQVTCPLSECQLFWYRALLMKDLGMLSNIESGKETTQTAAKSTYKLLNNLFMQLRKCCNHPYLFPGAEDDPDNTGVKELVETSGKLAVLDKLLLELFKNGHRAVLFSQFTRTLDLLEDYMRLRGYRYLRFDGSTSRVHRTVMINRFNEPGSQDFVFLMSTRAGGMGINLQTADTCILYDSDWNPQPDLQAMARVHRIGQTKTVHVYRLVTGGTIEERMVERAQKKLYLEQMVGRGSTSASLKLGSLTTSELLKTLKFGSDAVFGDNSDGKNTLPSDSEIKAIVDRTRDESTSTDALRGGTAQVAADYDPTKESKSSTSLFGVDFAALREEHAHKKALSIAEQWKHSKRERVDRLVYVNGMGSGYGQKLVPVLKNNNYELDKGENSVFKQELSGQLINAKESKSRTLIGGRDFGHQDMCQHCGDGGVLHLCHRCPVAAHFNCAPKTKSKMKNIWMCSHHHCATCGKSSSAAGGLLFRCQSCPNAFCEDCFPASEARVLGPLERFEKLGFPTEQTSCYVHCSKQCEQVALSDLGWTQKEFNDVPAPEPLDVSHAFGKTVF